MFSIEGEALTLAERRDLLDSTIRPALRSVPGGGDRLPGRRLHHLRGACRTTPAWRPRGSGSPSCAGPDAQQPQRRGRAPARGRGGPAGAPESGHPHPGGPGSHRGRTGHWYSRSGRRHRQVHLGAHRYGAVNRNGTGETVEGLVLGLRGPTPGPGGGGEAKLAELQATPPGGCAHRPSTTAAAWWTAPSAPSPRP